MTRMILIDSNSLLVLILGLMHPSLINKHKRTSIYGAKDFDNLLSKIKDIKSLVVLPNIWTEVDNLLNGFRRGHKDLYVRIVINVIKETSEKYLESHKVENRVNEFYKLGLTDTLILEYAKNCELLITSDSNLSDFARAMGINTYDMKLDANKRLMLNQEKRRRQ